jgi:hypothetical protein
MQRHELLKSTMTAHRHHHCAADACYTQVQQQRCAVMPRVVVISVWNKTSAGNQT